MSIWTHLNCQIRLDYLDLDADKATKRTQIEKVMSRNGLVHDGINYNEFLDLNVLVGNVGTYGVIISFVGDLRGYENKERLLPWLKKLLVSLSRLGTIRQAVLEATHGGEDTLIAVGKPWSDAEDFRLKVINTYEIWR